MSSFRNNNYVNSLNQLKQQHFLNIQKKKKVIDKQREIAREREIVRQREIAREREIVRQREIARQRRYYRQQERNRIILRQNQIEEQRRLNLQEEQELYNYYNNLRNFFSINEEYEIDNSYTSNKISLNDFNKLNKIKYNNKYNDSCPICITNFNDKELIIELNCNHNYHIDCIKKWLCESSNNCPLCKMCV